VAFDRPENAYQKAIRRFRMGVLRMAINKWYNDSPRHSLVDVVRDDLVIAPQSGLLGIIIQQIAQAIVTSHWAICSACAAPYQPERKPRKGQRRYCPACRRADIPHLHAVRDYRQRASRARPTSRG
jgi:hypothetical protein